MILRRRPVSRYAIPRWFRRQAAADGTTALTEETGLVDDDVHEWSFVADGCELGRTCDRTCPDRRPRRGGFRPFPELDDVKAARLHEINEHRRCESEPVRRIVHQLTPPEVLRESRDVLSETVSTLGVMVVIVCSQIGGRRRSFRLDFYEQARLRVGCPHLSPALPTNRRASLARSTPKLTNSFRERTRSYTTARDSIVRDRASSRCLCARAMVGPRATRYSSPGPVVSRGRARRAAFRYCCPPDRAQALWGVDGRRCVRH